MARITIKDIAEEAGVSINTVSRALNGMPDIRPETRQRVLEISSKLGYKPNKLAKGLRSQKTKTIGVLVTDIANPFFSRLVKAIGKAANDRDYSIILYDTDEDYAREQQAIDVMLAEQVDGLLIVPTQIQTDTVRRLKEDNFSFVLLGRHFDDLETPYVESNDVQGACMATQHLIEQGCRCVAFINGPMHISSAQQRLLGYQKGLEDFGMAFDRDMVLEGAITIRDGYRLAQQLFSKEAFPDGIFVYSDLVALGVIQAIRDAKVTIPGEVALVGYDDIEFSSFLNIPLSTIRIPKHQLGEHGLNLLHDIIEDNPRPSQQIKLNVKLIVRETSLRYQIRHTNTA